MSKKNRGKTNASNSPEVFSDDAGVESDLGPASEPNEAESDDAGQPEPEAEPNEAEFDDAGQSDPVLLTNPPTQVMPKNVQNRLLLAFADMAKTIALSPSRAPESTEIQLVQAVKQLKGISPRMVYELGDMPFYVMADLPTPQHVAKFQKHLKSVCDHFMAIVELLHGAKL